MAAIGHETKFRVENRKVYENKIMNIWSEGKTLEEEKEAWKEYINYEISQKMTKRAKLLYERGNTVIVINNNNNNRINIIG